MSGSGLSLRDWSTGIGTPRPQHMPQLDGLRAIAVGAVFVHHFLDLGALPWVLGKVNWGVLGVRLFFVLSGFLITGILLRARSAPAAAALRSFYMRRMLRIFPLYYAVVAVAIALNVGPGRELLPYLVTYTTNILISVRGEWIHAYSHFWSLAVEEQFYLFWPWVVLLAPARSLLPITVAMMACGPLYRALGVANEFSVQALRCFTFSAFDTLGMGALIAILGLPQQGALWSRAWLRRSWGIAGIAALGFTESLAIAGHVKSAEVLLDVSVALCFGWVICFAARGFRGPVGRLLEWAPMRYTGKIAYGLYVYHFFMPVVLVYALPGFGLTPPGPGVVNFLVCGSLAFAAAAVSWHLFEQPLNNLKRFFEYEPSGRGPVERTAGVRPGIRSPSLRKDVPGLALGD